MTEDLKKRMATEQGLRDVMKEWNVDVAVESDGFIAHGVHGEFHAVGTGPTVGDAVSAVVSELIHKEDAQLKETVEEGMKITTLSAALRWLVDHPKVLAKFESSLSGERLNLANYSMTALATVQSYVTMPETLRGRLSNVKLEYLSEVARLKSEIAWWEDALNTDEGE